MIKDFNKITRQVAISYLLHDKWCTEYTERHYDSEDLDSLQLDHTARYMAKRYEIIRFFRVIPDQATTKTKRDVVRAYVVNSSKTSNNLHLELIYTEDTDYNMELDVFRELDNVVPMYMLPDHIIDAFRVISLKAMVDHCQTLMNNHKIDHYAFDVYDKKFTTDKNNVKIFTYDMNETLY